MAKPMDLYLYNEIGESSYENVFSWQPKDPQWWITGFNPEIREVDVTKQVMIGSVDFSGHEKMYETLCNNVEKNPNLQKYMIFDEKSLMAWICWYERSGE